MMALLNAILLFDIPKEEFERWYRSQSRHRTAADRERDREIEAQTISIPEMAKLLGISREKVYWILDCKKYRDCFVIERVADRRRITKTSFEIWLNSQSTYRLQEPVMEAHEEPPLELKWKKQMGTFNLSGKHCTDCQLHSSAHRLDEAAGYLHSCDRGVLSAAAQI